MKVVLKMELMMMVQYLDEIVTNQDQGQQLLLLIHLYLIYDRLLMKMMVEEVVVEEIKIQDHQMQFVMMEVHDQMVHY
jgi:hypothetical protein